LDLLYAKTKYTGLPKRLYVAQLNLPKLCKLYEDARLMNQPTTGIIARNPMLVQFLHYPGVIERDISFPGVRLPSQKFSQPEGRQENNRYQ
jgi:hypothetical protein